MTRYAALDDTLYFHFGLNATSGSGDDGSTPLFDVRLCGAGAGAIPVLSGTPTLLSHANYPNGCYEVAITASVANGFADGSEYAVFVTATVSAVNPTGYVGGFKLAPVPANVTQVLGTAPEELDAIPADMRYYNGDPVPTAATAGYPVVTVKGGTGVGEFDLISGAVKVADKTGFSLTSGERDSIAAALLDLANGVESGKTLRQAMRLMAAALCGKRANAGTVNESYAAIGNIGTPRVVGNIDSSGNGTPILTP